MNAEYKKQAPSTYHSEQIERANKQIGEINSLSDEELIINRKKQIAESIEDYRLSKAKNVDLASRYTKMIEEAKKWTPSTDEHMGIKKFMIEQLEESLKFDCGGTFYDDTIKSLEEEFKTLDGSKIRKEFLEDKEKNIEYHTTEHKKEVERCEKNNLFVEQFFNSLK